MTNVVKITTIVATIALLNACASTSKVAYPQVKAKEINSEVNYIRKNSVVLQEDVDKNEQGGYLHTFASEKKELDKNKVASSSFNNIDIITSSDTGKFNTARTALFIASVIALAPTTMPSNPDGKYGLKGKLLATIDNQSLLAAYTPVKDYVFATYGKDNQHAYFPLNVEGTRLFLVYEKFSAGDGGNYELVQTITFNKTAESKKPSDDLNYECRQSSVSKPLAQWQANDYKLVHEVAKQYAATCAELLLSKEKQSLDKSFEKKMPALIHRL
ncbi:MAG: hypothetical protein Q4G13_07985 [Moraxella sp.]|nr:hypothetical protein [Moraxella sp.]